MDFNISHESVRKALRNGECLYWLNEELELSEYYDYDAQWIRKEGKWIFRLELFDIINNMQVACLISEKFHLIKNMTINLKPKITEELDKYEAELRKNNPKISESKIKKIRKNKKEELSDEIKLYIGLFYELFHQQSLTKQ